MVVYQAPPAPPDPPRQGKKTRTLEDAGLTESAPLREKFPMAATTCENIGRFLLFSFDYLVGDAGELPTVQSSDFRSLALQLMLVPMHGLVLSDYFASYEAMLGTDRARRLSQTALADLTMRLAVLFDATFQERPQEEPTHEENSQPPRPRKNARVSPPHPTRVPVGQVQEGPSADQGSQEPSQSSPQGDATTQPRPAAATDATGSMGSGPTPTGVPPRGVTTPPATPPPMTPQPKIPRAQLRAIGHATGTGTYARLCSATTKTKIVEIDCSWGPQHLIVEAVRGETLDGYTVWEGKRREASLTFNKRVFLQGKTLRYAFSFSMGLRTAIPCVSGWPLHRVAQCQTFEEADTLARRLNGAQRKHLQEAQAAEAEFCPTLRAPQHSYAAAARGTREPSPRGPVPTPSGRGTAPRAAPQGATAQTPDIVALQKQVLEMTRQLTQILARLPQPERSSVSSESVRSSDSEESVGSSASLEMGDSL